MSTTLEDLTGFGWSVTVTDPAGVTADLVGQSNDIHQVIDPGTGVVMFGRVATVALRLSSLAAAGLAVPQAIADTDVKPWIVTFLDVGGISYTFKVSESNPDRTLGLVVCVLEAYS